jgi:sulfide dehydrogenase cytochrome subunit
MSARCCEFWLPVACAAALLAAGCTGAARQPDSLSQAALLASGCTGCHASGRAGIAATEGAATEGSTAPGIPALGGYSAQRLEALLQKYQGQSDGASAMHRLARGYSDDELRLIAAYLGRQSEGPP